jgi:tetratricopeptide (TPR) repeat protein
MTFRYDLFVSYARKDNQPSAPGQPGWITAFVAKLQRTHRQFTPEDLSIFFDKDDIRVAQDWEMRIKSSLRDSNLLLACISPSYFASEWCHREWELYAQHELDRAVGGEGVNPVYFIEVPGFEGKLATDAWIEDLRRRQHIDLRPWFSEGVEALQLEDVGRRLEVLDQQIDSAREWSRSALAAPGTVDRHNTHFVGRREELRKLREMLACGTFGVITAVQGLGGVGKSALANEYAHAYATEYGGGRWVVRCEGLDSLATALVQLATPLNIEFNDVEKKDSELAVQRVLAEIEARTTSARSLKRPHPAVLLIFDNVDQPALLAPSQIGKLPKVPWLHVLATTRLGQDQLFEKQPDRQFLSLDELPEPDALQLIERLQAGGTFRSAAEREAARTIARMLGGFPLAVEGVAVYLGVHPEITCEQFRQRLEAEGLGTAEDVVCDGDVGERIRHREKQLHVVLDQTLSHLAPPEHCALDYGALLPPDSIPWPWLQALAANEHPEILAVKPGYPDPWLSLRRRLEGLRLLTPSSLPQIARMHRLVGATLGKISPKRSRSRRLARLARFVSSTGTPFGYGLPIEVFLRAWQLIGQSLPLTQMFIQQAKHGNPPLELTQKWVELSYQLGDSVLEEWWLNHWTELGPTNHAYAQARAALMHRQGNTEGACLLLREHLHAGGEDLDTSIRLIMYLSQLGRHQEAEEAATKVADVHAARLSNDPLRRAHFLHCSYFILHELDKNLDAVAVCRLIRDTYVQKCLSYDSLIASVNLGDALWAIGELDEARETLQFAIAQGQSSGLAQVENIAAICLANVLSSNGSNEEALEYYELGLAVTNRIDHRWDLLYARVYQALNDLELGRVSSDVFGPIRSAAVDAGFSYLSAVADAHICVGSFTGQAEQRHLWEAVGRGLQSTFPAVRLYALCAVIRSQFALGDAPDACHIREWLRVLDAVQGIKGRVGVVAQTAEWLLESGNISERDAFRVRDWVCRYVPRSLIGYFRSRYRFPMEGSNGRVQC